MIYMKGFEQSFTGVLLEYHEIRALTVGYRERMKTKDGRVTELPPQAVSSSHSNVPEGTVVESFPAAILVYGAYFKRPTDASMPSFVMEVQLPEKESLELLAAVETGSEPAFALADKLAVASLDYFKGGVVE